MVEVLHNNIFLILLACVVGMASLVEAWTTTSLVVSGCALTINPRLASLAIHYRNESVDDQQFEFQATTATSTTTITSFTTTTEEHDTNISLQIALQAAQDATVYMVSARPLVFGHGQSLMVSICHPRQVVRSTVTSSESLVRRRVFGICTLSSE